MANPDRCPHCGGENGVHTKELVEFKQFYDWDGSYDCGEHGGQVRGGKNLYCMDCGRDVTNCLTVQRPK